MKGIFLFLLLSLTSIAHSQDATHIEYKNEVTKSIGGEEGVTKKQMVVTCPINFTVGDVLVVAVHFLDDSEQSVGILKKEFMILDDFEEENIMKNYSIVSLGEPKQIGRVNWLGLADVQILNAEEFGFALSMAGVLDTDLVMVTEQQVLQDQDRFYSSAYVYPAAWYANTEKREEAARLAQQGASKTAIEEAVKEDEYDKGDYMMAGLNSFVSEPVFVPSFQFNAEANAIFSSGSSSSKRECYRCAGSGRDYKPKTYTTKDVSYSQSEVFYYRTTTTREEQSYEVVRCGRCRGTGEIEN